MDERYSLGELEGKEEEEDQPSGHKLEDAFDRDGPLHIHVLLNDIKAEALAKVGNAIRGCYITTIFLIERRNSIFSPDELFASWPTTITSCTDNYNV